METGFERKSIEIVIVKVGQRVRIAGGREYEVGEERNQERDGRRLDGEVGV